ncbi:MAG TPA: DUF4926 domain-containing protein [Hyphomicrobiales bacterium]|jgi:hypothetical protein
MINELDLVVLQEDLPTEGLRVGDVGCVVMVYEGGKGFEVEFTTLTGRTVSVVTLQPNAIRPVEPTDITHARAALA